MASKASDPVSDSGLVPPAPCFYPSEEEFTDPLAYVASIRAKAEPFGICRIRPPKGWKPPYAIDKRTFRFKTRVQSIHELYHKGTSAASLEWHQGYDSWLNSTGRKTWKKNPIICGSEIDLYTLQRAVNKRGGYQAVVDKKLWKDVARIVGMKDLSTHAAYNLRQMYQQKVLPYDEWVANPQNKGSDNIEEAAALLLGIAPEKGSPVKPACCPPKKKAKLFAKTPTEKQAPENINELLCDACLGGQHEDQIILCDKCDHGWHMFCLSPPISEVPEGEWICPTCLSQQSDSFCFKEGDDYSLPEFEAVANNFRSDYTRQVGVRLGKAPEDITWQDMERDFWDIVEHGDEPIEVIYGADLDTGHYGSGFPLDPSSPDAAMSAYAKHVWNINNFPQLSGKFPSLLKHIEDKITGVMVPWMYVGMMYSAFCWHIEDHMFYSVNYMHWGEAKRWYGVPAYATHAFEEAFKEWLPDQFAIQPDLLFQLVTMLSPNKLRQSGVPVYGVVQEEGDFVITFPSAYHGGFNTGFNCAEAVNFCPPDWLRFASASQERYRHFRRPPVLSLEELVLNVAKEKDLSPEAAAWVALEMERIYTDESALRMATWSKGITHSTRVEHLNGMLPGQDEDPECCVCHSILHLSAVQCCNHKCNQTRLVCLHHSDQLCECGIKHYQMLFRHTCKDLEGALKTVKTLAARAAWQPSWHFTRKPASSSYTNLHCLDEPREEDEEEETQADPMAVEPRRPRCGITAMLDAAASSDIGMMDEQQENGAAPAEVPLVTAMAEDSATPKAKLELLSDSVMESHAAHVNGTVPSAPAEAKLDSPAPVVTTTDPGLAMAGVKRERQEPPEVEAAAPAGEEAKAEEEEEDLPKLKQVLSKRDAMMANFIAAPMINIPDGLPCELEASCKAWIKEAQSCLEQGRCRLTDLKLLIREGSSFKWGWSEEVDPLVAKLQEALAWGKKCQAFTSKKGSLEEVEAIVFVDPPPALVSGLKKLRDGVAAAREVMPRLEAMRKVLEDEEAEPPLLADLEEVVTEAMSNQTVEIPLAQELQARLSAANKWVATVKKLMPSGELAAAEAAAGSSSHVSVAGLLDLQAEGQEMHIAMPMLTELDNACQQCSNWQAQAREVLDAKPPLARLEELLESSNANLVFLQEAVALAELRDKAEAFVRDSTAAISNKACLKDMRDLLHSGERLNVELPNVDVLRAAIWRREWDENAEKMLCSKACTLTQMGDLLKEAKTMNAEDTEAAAKLQAKHLVASAADGKLRGLLSTLESPEPGKLGSVTQGDLAAAVSEASSVGVKLESLARCNALLEACSEWNSKAELLTAEEQKPDNRLPANVLENLLEASFGLPVSPERVALLHQLHHAAKQWSAQAEELMAAGPAASHEEVNAHLAAARGLRVQTPEEAVLKKLHGVGAWNSEVGAAFLQPTSAATEGRAFQVPLEQAQTWLQEAEGVPVDSALKEQLVQAVAAALAWGKRISSALNCGRGGDRWLRARLEEACREAEALAVQPAGLDTVKEALESSEQWEKSMQEKASKAQAEGRRFKEQELEEAVEAGLAIPVASDQLEGYCSVLAALEEWEVKLKGALAKRGSHAKLDDLLAALGRASSLFLAMVERHGGAAAVQQARAGLGPDLAGFSVDVAVLPESPMCLCGETDADSNAAWVCCDVCSCWHHVRCQGITTGAAKTMKKFVCTMCTALKPGCKSSEAVASEAALARLHRTRSPASELLAGHLAAAKELAVEGASADKLGAALAAYQVGMAAASKVLDKHLAALLQSCPVQEAAGCLTDESAHGLLVAALTSEISSPRLLDKALSGVRRLRWRVRADAVLFRDKEPVGAAMQTVTQILKEGNSLGPEVQGCWAMKELAGHVQTAKDWSERARAALEATPKVAADLQLLSEEGERLRKVIKVDKLLSELTEAGTLYCYCRQLHEAERVMMACDKCDEWYHCECVGMPAPLEDLMETDEGTEATEADFCCPSCTFWAGQMTAEVMESLPQPAREAILELQIQLEAGQQQQRRRRSLEEAEPAEADAVPTDLPANIPVPPSRQDSSQQAAPQAPEEPQQPAPLPTEVCHTEQPAPSPPQATAAQDMPPASAAASPPSQPVPGLGMEPSAMPLAAGTPTVPPPTAASQPDPPEAKSQGAASAAPLTTEAHPMPPPSQGICTSWVAAADKPPQPSATNSSPEPTSGPLTPDQQMAPPSAPTVANSGPTETIPEPVAAASAPDAMVAGLPPPSHTLPQPQPPAMLAGSPHPGTPHMHHLPTQVLAAGSTMNAR